MVTVLNETIARSGGAVCDEVLRSAAVIPDIGQAYFWTSTWQDWEREADEDLAEGRYADFADTDSLLKDLDTPDSAEEG